MPRKAIDYSRCLMYKIVCNDLSITDIYVGHTTDFTKRKNQHKYECTNPSGNGYEYKVYECIRANGLWENWSMILIEYYPCKSSLEATQRERYWKEQLNATLNTQVPSRTDKEYYTENKDKISEYKKKHYNGNKDHYTEYKKQWYNHNKEKITENGKLYYEKNKDKLKQKSVCECGGLYTCQSKQTHLRTHKHKHYEENKLYYIIRQGLDIIKAIDAKLDSQLDL